MSVRQWTGVSRGQTLLGVSGACCSCEIHAQKYNENGAIVLHKFSYTWGFRVAVYLQIHVGACTCSTGRVDYYFEGLT